MFSTFFTLCIGLLALTQPSECQRRGGPRVVTEPQEFVVEAGSSVILPCNIRNVGRRSVFWFKGDSPDERELIMQMKSVRGQFQAPRQYQEIIETGKLMTNGSSLIVNNLVAADASAYTCSIAWARQSVTHTLVVTGDAALTLTKIPTDGEVHVREGLPAYFSCVATSEPPATVSWFKEGESDILSVSNVLNFYTSKREDSGRYICRAENGVADPITATFSLTVEYVEVQAEASEVVASGEDRMAQLGCRVNGFPKPQVAWYTQAGPVAQDQRHRMFSRDGVHYLQILQMNTNDLGEYQCYGYNEKSRDHALVKVTSAPGPVTVLGVSRYAGESYRVTWEVNSLAPIRFYHVALRERGSSSVDSTSVPGSSRPSDGRSLFRASSEFEMIPGKTYEIMIKAVAEEYQPGPDQEEPFVFTVPEQPGAPVTVDYRPPSNTRPQTSEGRGRETTYGGRGTTYASLDEDYSDYDEETQTEVSDDDAWKWWKVTMTLMSRLPQVARILQ